MQDYFRLGEEYTFRQLEPFYKSDEFVVTDYGIGNLIGKNAIVFADEKETNHWFILASASGADFYYKYVFRG